jgi:hypothetical protein
MGQKTGKCIKPTDPVWVLVSGDRAPLSDCTHYKRPLHGLCSSTIYQVCQNIITDICVSLCFMDVMPFVLRVGDIFANILSSFLYIGNDVLLKTKCLLIFAEGFETCLKRSVLKPHS